MHVTSMQTISVILAQCLFFCWKNPGGSVTKKMTELVKNHVLNNMNQTLVHLSYSLTKSDLKILFKQFMENISGNVFIFKGSA